MRKLEEWKWETPVFAAKGNVVTAAAFLDPAAPQRVGPDGITACSAQPCRG